MQVDEYIENARVTRMPNVVTIIWKRNPLDRQAKQTIASVSITGFFKPCHSALQEGKRYKDAVECLVTKGFEQITNERFGTFGISVFVHKSY